MALCDGPKETAFDRLVDVMVGIFFILPMTIALAGCVLAVICGTVAWLWGMIF